MSDARETMEGVELKAPTTTKTTRTEMAEKQGQELDVTLEMTRNEAVDLLAIQQDRRFIESEMRNVEVREANFWMRLEMRTGYSLQDCTADTRTGRVYPKGVNPTI